MAMRVTMFAIILIVYALEESTNTNENILQLKLQVISFYLPYYCYLIVLVSLIFSALQFYKSIRNLLFPQLMEKDDDNFVHMKVMSRSISSKNKFRAIYFTTFTLVLIFSIIVLQNHVE